MFPSAFCQKVFQERQQLAALLKQNYKDQKIVFTNGCFDILHSGHVLYLYQARQLGDLLIIGLNSDASVRRLKGNTRPIHSWENRAMLLAAIACVDFILYFDEDSPEDSIAALAPQIHCKGGDYKAEELPETALVRKIGGEVRILPFVAGCSTTGLIDKIKGL